MKMQNLGQSGIRVSGMSLGCLYFGARDSKEKSFRRLDQYLDAGGNFLDTANMYSHWISDTTSGGESEEMIGRWLQERGNRSQVVIASKVGFPYKGVEQGTSARQIREECDKSLKRMGIDYIDLYYAHTDDLDTPMEETLGAFNELIAAGKVRAIGASNFRAWRLERARQICQRNGWVDYCCIQQRYSYLRPKTGWDFGAQIAVNEDLLAYIKDTKITLLAYSPLLKGAYTSDNKAIMDQYIGPDTDARLKMLSQIAKEVGATPNQIVYYWLMHHDPGAIPLVASTTDEQFEEAVGAMGLSLLEEQMERLTQAGH